MSEGITLPISVTPGPDMLPAAEAAGVAAGAAAGKGYSRSFEGQSRARSALGSVPGAPTPEQAGKAGKEGFEGFIQAWRKDEKREDRHSGFIAGQVAQLGLLEGEAGRVAGKLATILSGGFGLMAAIDVLKWGIEVSVEHFRKLREDAETVAKVMEEAPREYANVSIAQMKALGVVSRDTATATGKKFSDVYRQMAKDAQEHFAKQRALLADYEASLNKVSPAQGVLAKLDVGAGEVRRKGAADLAVLDAAHAKAKAAVDSYRASMDKLRTEAPAAYGFVSLGKVGLENLTADADKAATAIKNLRVAMGAAAGGEASTFSEAVRLIDLERFTRQAEQAAAANTAMHELEVKTALTSASDRQRIEIELGETLRKLKLEWAGKDEDYAAQVRVAAIAASGAQRAALDRRQAEELRAARLAVLKVGMGEEQRIRADGAEEERRILDRLTLARKAGVAEEVAYLQQLLASRRQLIAAQTGEAGIASAYQGAQARDAARQAEAARVGAWGQTLEKSRADSAARIEERQRVAAIRSLTGVDQEAALRLRAIDKAQADEMRVIEEGAARGQLGVAEYEAEKTEIVRRYAEQRGAILRKESALQLGLSDIGKRALSQLASSVGASMGSLAVHAGAYDRALAKASGNTKEYSTDVATAVAAQTQAILSGVADQATVKAVFELAEGFAALFTNPAAATAHFTSAAIFGGIGGIAAGLGYGLGEARGMTGSEQQSVDQAQAGAAGSMVGGASAREAGATAGGAVTTRETIIVIGDPFETPQETARRAARRIQKAKSLDLLAREA